MSTEFPELGGHFPDPFVSLAIRPLSEALWMFPSYEGSPRIDHAGVLAFEAFHGLDAEDAPVYLEIIRAGVHAYNDGRRRGYAQRARRQREKLRA